MTLAATMQPAAQRTIVAKPTRTPSPKILVIDDDPELLRTFQLRFKDFDVELFVAFHGMHGIWLATNEHPDLIITDVRMPQGEGSYVMQCLSQRAETAAIPVLVLTGMRDHDLEARLLRLGATKVFHKPVAFDLVLTEVAKHIELCKRP